MAQVQSRSGAQRARVARCELKCSLVGGKSAAIVVPFGIGLGQGEMCAQKRGITLDGGTESDDGVVCLPGTLSGQSRVEKRVAAGRLLPGPLEQCLRISK